MNTYDDPIENFTKYMRINATDAMDILREMAKLIEVPYRWKQ